MAPPTPPPTADPLSACCWPGPSCCAPPTPGSNDGVDDAVWKETLGPPLGLPPPPFCRPSAAAASLEIGVTDGDALLEGDRESVRLADGVCVDDTVGEAVRVPLADAERVDVPLTDALAVTLLVADRDGVTEAVTLPVGV